MTGLWPAPTARADDDDPSAGLHPPWTLARLAQAADAIAEIEVGPLTTPDAQDQWRIGHFIVRRWIKQPAQLTDPNLMLPWSPTVQPYIPPSLREGARFLVFLNHQAAWGSLEGWQHRYRVHPTGRVTAQGAPGLFEIANGRIGYAGLAQYHGWSVTAFETAIRRALAQPPPILPDPDPRGLIELARQSAIIADVDIVHEDVGTGRYFYDLAVRNWFKQPANITEDAFGASYSTNPIDPHKSLIDMADRSDHRVVFKTESEPPGGWLESGAAVYGISDGYVVSESFLYSQGKAPFPHPHSYLGWPADRFFAAVRAAVARADRPLPASGQPTGDGVAPGWLALGMATLLLGAAIRRAAHRPVSACASAGRPGRAARRGRPGPAAPR